MNLKRTAAISLALLALTVTTASAQGAGSIGARWEAERAAMLKQVVERTREHVRDVQKMAEIGTMAAVDVRTAAQSLADLEKLVEADAKQTPPRTPAPADIAARRIRFAEALNNLDGAEVRFDNGMITVSDMNAALMAAAQVLLAPAPPRLR